MAEIKTGGVKMIEVDGKYHVWTKRVGSGPMKMLTLHGGPGCTHEYFECFEDFLPGNGVEFFYYDQLGSAYSDQPNDPNLWRIERFREEVEQVRTALGLESFFLFGHSWGAMLAIDYALKYQRHLKGLVLSNMTASIKSYVTYINTLRDALPPKTLEILKKYEAAENYDAPEYQAVMFKEIYSRHICRIDPFPEPLARMFRHLNASVYNTMQGPNEFVVTGTFRDWDRWADLKFIQVPVLLLVGRHDTMSVTDIKRMGELIPAARVVVCEQGSHCSMYDDQEKYFRALVDFANDVEQGALPTGSTDVRR
jgi:proline iminopeptidase